ncbi:MAG: VTT domain-containing protein, partial [Chromatocurvus sp.]
MRSPIAAIMASALAVAALVGVLVWLDVDERLLEILRWIEGQGMLSVLWFVLIMAAVVLLLLPGVLFTTGAGFVFGVLEGTAYVVIGTTLGACLAFLLARYCTGQRTRAWIRRHADFHAVTREMEQHDFQVVLLTRLI